MLPTRTNRLLLLICLLLLPIASYAGSLDNAMETSASAMQAQKERMRIVSENIANQETTGASSTEEPYRRKTIFFGNEQNPKTGANIVKVKRIGASNEEFKTEYLPYHPAADANGYVRMPNVNKNLEMMDMRQAQRSYEANISAIETSRNMNERALDLLR